MPHITLEYSSNITEKNNFSDYFSQTHNLLVEKLSANIDACKSRAVKHDNCHLGDGNSNNAFIHITLKILPGRSEDIIKETADSLIELTRNHFPKSLEKLNLKISVEIANLEFYLKK